MILQNKIALITGAGGVIGNTIAGAMAKEGCNLLLVGRSLQKLSATKESVRIYGTQVDIFAADVSKVEDVERLMDFISSHFGKLDILVSAAASYGEIGRIEHCNADAWLNTIKTNLFGTFIVIKLAIPLLEKSNLPKIITFAGGGENPIPAFSAYASSKSAVIRLTQCLGEELKQNNIEINAISPGLVKSGFTEDIIKAGPLKAGQEKYDEALKEFRGEKVTAEPLKAAALAVFLASAKSNGLTGKNISACWDSWQNIPDHLKELEETDIYNWRRIKPQDYGLEW